MNRRDLGSVAHSAYRTLRGAIHESSRRANGDRVGTIVLANTRPRRITADDVEPLELLVAQLAAMIGTASPRTTR